MGTPAATASFQCFCHRSGIRGQVGGERLIESKSQHVTAILRREARHGTYSFSTGTILIVFTFTKPCSAEKVSCVLLGMSQGSSSLASLRYHAPERQGILLPVVPVT